MKSIRFKFLYLVISTLILLSLALPVFSFKIAGKEFSYPSIGFSKINIPSDFPDFKKGNDLYLSYKYVAKLDFGETVLTTSEKENELSKAKDIVRARADYANLNDISIASQIVNDEYFLAIEIPQNYLNPQDYASWLTTKGEISISAIDFNSGEEINISAKEIAQIYKSASFQVPLSNGSAQNYNIANLLIVINENVKNKILEFKNLIRAAANQSTDASSPSYVATLNIDSFSLQVIPDDKKPNWIRAIPSFNEADVQITSKYESDFLSIMQSLVTEEASMAYPMTLNEGREEISTIYNSNGGTITAIGFIVGTLLMLILLIITKQLSKRNIVPFILILTNTTLLTVVLLKLVQAYLSTGLLIGFILTTLIFVMISLKMVKVDEYIDFKNKLKKLQILSLLTLIWSLSIYKLAINLGQYNDLISLITLVSVVLLIQSAVYMNIVMQIFTNSKFKFKKLLSFKSK